MLLKYPKKHPKNESKKYPRKNLLFYVRETLRGTLRETKKRLKAESKNPYTYTHTQATPLFYRVKGGVLYDILHYILM